MHECVYPDPGLACFQRNGRKQIPGCTSGSVNAAGKIQDINNWDYCDNKTAVDKELPQARPALLRSWDTFQAPCQTRMRHAAC